MPQQVLITGGDSGIGFALAQLFGADGHHLTLVSENELGLHQAQQQLRQDYPAIEVKTLTQDLTHRNGPKKVKAFTETLAQPIDILVNNAGFGNFGFLTELNPVQEADSIRLNVLALQQLTHLFLPMIINSSNGGIINIASIASFQPVPTMATYAATKAFVRSFSIALRHELREQGHSTKVLTVCPTGIGDTRFKERAQMQNNPLFNNWMSVTTKRVARDTYRAYHKDRTYVVPKRWLHWANHAAQRMPLSWQLYFARQTLKK